MKQNSSSPSLSIPLLVHAMSTLKVFVAPVRPPGPGF